MFDERAAGTDDPRYRRGLVHLQAGAWQEAIDCFEELAHDYPGSPDVQRTLDEARFKADLDGKMRVRAKRWIIPWRPILVRGLILVGIIVVAVQATRLVQGPVAEALALAREEQRLAQKESECARLLEGGDLDGAEVCCQELLAEVPDHEACQQAEEQIAEERQIQSLYQEGVAAYEAGDFEQAEQFFTELQLLRWCYLDSCLLIDGMRREEERDALFRAADEDYAAGRRQEALAKYRQLRELYATYQRDLVEDRLYALNMDLGRALIEQNPPATEGVSQALDHFSEALTLRPSSTEANLEKELAQRYLDGEEWYRAGQWEGAISRLRAVYDRRPGYLSGTVAGMLYEAYLYRGDQFRDAEDCGLAYEMYGEAAVLPVADATVARARRAAIAYCVPPTLTPTNTPTPTPTPTNTPYVPPPPPTDIPTPTPTPTPRPLAAFRNRIIFRSDDPEQPGYWAMEPSGQNRQYLGHPDYYAQEINAYRQREAFSPDGRYRAVVQDGAQSPQIFILLPQDDYPNVPPQELTRLTHMSYDPVWSPDGGRIAFTSHENGSADIWVVNTDGTGIRYLVRNDWEWDKHPSWSPDSRFITFWSNRNLLKQIYVMDAQTGQLRNISETQWDEYDPVWIK